MTARKHHAGPDFLPASQRRIRILQIALLLFPAVVLWNLLQHEFVLGKRLSQTYRPGRATNIIVPTRPSSLVRTADTTSPWKITTDEFPFRVTIPRIMESVRVRMELDKGTQPYLSVKAEGKHGADLTSIVHVASLDKLEWNNTVDDNGTTVWSRSETSELLSTQSLREQQVAPESIGVVGLDRMAFTTIPDYQPASTPLRLPQTLRGSHTLYVYAADETLRLAFDKIDLNRAEGADQLTVRVARADSFRASHPVWLTSQVFRDDGIVDAKAKHGVPRRVMVEVPNATRGVYLVQVVASDDVLLSNFESAQHHLAFTGSVWMAEGPAYGKSEFSPSTVFLNGSFVTGEANHTQGRQTIRVGTRTLVLREVKKGVTLRNLNEVSSFIVERGDAVLTTDGLLTFSPARLLPAGARVIDPSAGSPTFEGIDYVVADYVPNNAKQIYFDRTYTLDALDLLGKSLIFSLQAPGLKANGASLGFRSVHVTLERGPLPWKKIPEKIRLFFSR